MKDFKGLAHAVLGCKRHIVWCSKYEFKILKGKVGRSVPEIIERLFGKIFDINLVLKR
jgi:REP element-mobilizing transposase RayT